MSARLILTTPSFDDSLRKIEKSFAERLAAPRLNHYLPNFTNPIIMKEWEDFDVCCERLSKTPATDPAFKVLEKLTEKENYYSFHHRMFRAYFVLDVQINVLVGLFVKRSNTDGGEDLLRALEKARKRYSKRVSK